MGVYMKTRNSTYFRKVIAFYVLLSTLPVLVLGIFSTWKSSKMIQEKVNESNLQVLHQTQMAVEENLKFIHNYYTLFAYSQETTNMIDKELNYRDIDSILKTQEELQGLMNIHTTVKNAYLIHPEGGWFISNESVGRLDELGNQQQLLDLINGPENIYWTYIDPQENQDASRNYMDFGKIAMVIRFPFNQEQPKAGVIVSLSQYQFNKMIHSKETVERFLIIDENNRVLYDDDDSIIGHDFAESFLKDAQWEKDNNSFFTAKIDGEKVGINYTTSPYNGWTYFSIYSIYQIQEDSRAIAWVTFLLCVGLMGLSLGISALGSNKMIYKPVRNIYNSVKNEISITTNVNIEDEMKYIGEGINTLITSRHAMEKQIKLQLQQVEELFLIRLIQGEIQVEEIQEKMKSLGETKEWKKISIISIEVDSIHQEGEVIDPQDMIMLGINRIMEEVLGNQIFLKPIFTKQVQTILVKSDEVEEENVNHSMYDSAKKIQTMIKKRLNTIVSIGISRPFEELLDTQIAYKESLEALRCRIGLGEEVILFFHEVQPGQYIRQAYPKTMANDLIHAINMEDRERAGQLLDQLVDQIVKEQLNFNEYQVCFTRLLIEVIGVLQDSGESINRLFENKSNIFEEVNQLTNAEDMKQWFKAEIIYPIITIREERSENTHKQILDDVLSIIQEEYAADLTLEECASRLNYHPSYIWKIMRKELDTSFSEYVAQYRLQVAKQWLEETDLSILEISEKMKYNNSQNFIRYFKKLEGITPGQYRKEYRKNNV